MDDKDKLKDQDEKIDKEMDQVESDLEDEDDIDDDDEFDAEEEQNEATQMTSEETVKSVKQAPVVQAVLSIIRFIKNLPLNLKIIVICILIIFFLILLLIASFTDDNNVITENYYRLKFAIVDHITWYEYTAKDDLMRQRLEARKELEGELTSDEIDEIKKNILELNSDIDQYEIGVSSYFDTQAGVQILNQDGTLLNYMERLSYASNYTDWEPEYDIDGKLEKEIEELTEEIERQEAMSDTDPEKWSALKLRNQKEYLKKLNTKNVELGFAVDRYHELNVVYKEIIDEDFVNSEREAKVHPDGLPVTDKVEAYFKDRYGVETEEIMKELTYFHTVMVRTKQFSKQIYSDNTDKINAWLKDPHYEDDEFVSESDRGIDLADVENSFKVKFEIVHHETTLELIKSGTTQNALMTNPDAFDHMKTTISRHMPIFQYATYSDKIADKTFYDYELYDEEYFDGNGNYIMPEDFSERINFFNGEDTSIDFTRVIDMKENEFMLEKYQADLSIAESSDVQDAIYIEELKELIEMEEDKCSQDASSDELLEKYQQNFNNVQNMIVHKSEESRPFDPHNHLIVVDEKDPEYKYYLEYADMIVDDYVENVKVVETFISNCGRPGGQNQRVTSWHETTGRIDESACAHSVNSFITTTTRQSSLKPVKIRSLLNSANYTYTKTEEREEEVDTKLNEARANAKWQKREIYDGSSFFGTEYKKEIIVTITNHGEMTASLQPFETNEVMKLSTLTYLTDFYGQTELLTGQDIANTPGTLRPGEIPGGQGTGHDVTAGERTFVPGETEIKYFYQFNYPNEPYTDATTIAKSGCATCCLAMCISSMTSADVTPPDMAKWLGDRDYYVAGEGTKWSGIKACAEAYGLNVHEIRYGDTGGVTSALANGHPVIMIAGPGVFTRHGHYIVLTGIDENGMVSINDPGSTQRTARKWSIDTIMSNASTKCGLGAYTFWELS